MSKKVEDWEEDGRFQQSKRIVCNLQVCNDSAERGVKLASDFIKSAKNEDRFQQILQVVENSRHSLPNQRNKRKIKHNQWYLVV